MSDLKALQDRASRQRGMSKSIIKSNVRLKGLPLKQFSGASLVCISVLFPLVTVG